jgi:hypothetical protein
LLLFFKKEGLSGVKEERFFFFEKKKQKTFVCLGARFARFVGRVRLAG